MRVLVVTQKEVLNGVGGAITMFKNFCSFLQDSFEVKGICYAPNSSIESKDIIDNIYFSCNKASYADCLNTYIDKFKPNLIVFFYNFLLFEADFTNRPDIQNIPKILMFHSRPDFYFAYFKDSETRLKQQYQNVVSQIHYDEFWDLLPNFIKQNRVVSIPNFVSNHEYRADLTQEKKKIVFFSRIDCWKGLEFLIDSATIFLKDNDWTLDIYGDCPDALYKECLENRIKKNNLINRVVLKGCVSNAFETLIKYDFYVSASMFEGQCMSALESMSVGLPCVVLNSCSGLNIQVTNGITGFVAKNSIEDFASCVKKLINSQELRLDMSKNALKESGKYSKTIVCNYWKQTITEILSNASVLSNSVNVSMSQGYREKILDIDKIIALDQQHSIEMKEYAAKKYPQKKNNKFLESIFSLKKNHTTGDKVLTVLGIKKVISNAEHKS